LIFANFKVINFKKGRFGRSMFTTLDLWEGRGRRQDVFFIESEKFDP
jgi:hypothetical protein